MKKFKVEVTTSNTYEVEIDENALNEEWMQEFRETFYSFNSLEEHAQQIAEQRVRKAERTDSFLEGYGKVRVKDYYGFDSKKWDSPVDGITINVIDEEEITETEVKEIL
ncbi:hypothetical protein [Paenibacillus sp. O199]|uniref:hypothetical protein n=1 Tax=Paenibacillus sp. O199 TaxID=1643925 RepID=UPI0007BF822A|nr:hypothetical protein [Paenibacillus sp. O199]